MAGNTQNDRAALIRRLRDFTSQFEQHAVDPIGDFEDLEHKQLSDAEIDAYLEFHRFKPLDIEHARKAFLKLIGNRQSAVDSLTAYGIEIVGESVTPKIRAAAKAIAMLRDLFLPSVAIMPSPIPAMGMRTARSISTQGDTESQSSRMGDGGTKRAEVIDALNAHNIRVIPIEWSSPDAVKSKLTLYFIREWPPEPISVSVTIDGRQVSTGAPIENKKEKLMYLVLDVGPRDLTDCEVTLARNLLTLAIQTNPAKG